MSGSDFIRPRGVEEGILLNSNQQALKAYKKAKRRMSLVDELEERLDDMEDKYNKILQLLEAK